MSGRKIYYKNFMTKGLLVRREGVLQERLQLELPFSYVFSPYRPRYE